MSKLIITIHIAGGVLGILSGMTSLFTKKGGFIHNNSGKFFFISMLVMAVTATYLAIFHEYQETNIVVGFLTIYLVITARRTLTNPKGKSGWLEKVMMVYAIMIGILGIVFITQVLELRGSNLGPIDYFLFLYTFIAWLGVLLDATVIFRGGVFGRKRIVRHIWRMTFALWIAVGAFFLGQPQAFPKLLEENVLLRALPFILVTLLLLFWIVRVWFIKRFKHLKPNPF